MGLGMKFIELLRSGSPVWVKSSARKLRKACRYRWREWTLRRPVRQGKVIKIIVGAAETWRSGWYATNEQWFDIASKADWAKNFRGKFLLSHVVAEHVFEHLTPAETEIALEQIAKHLLPGGRLRIAVPDGYHPDPIYRAHTCVGGIGDDASDHKQVFNVDSLTEVLESAGLKCIHVEGYRNDGQLILTSYSTDDGYIWRSRLNRADSVKLPWRFPDSDTSLIVDAVKGGNSR